MHLTVCSYHVRYPFQSESTLYICLNFIEHLAQNRPDISSLSDCNRARTHNHLVGKITLNHLTKLTKWLSWVVSIYLYGIFNCIFLSCHARVSEWIHTLHLPECQGTPCWKQVRYLKFKWLERDSNQQLFFFVNEHSTVWPNWPNNWVELWVPIYRVHLTVFFYHFHIVPWHSGKNGFTLNRVHNMIRTYRQMHRTDKYSQISSIIWSV